MTSHNYDRALGYLAEAHGRFSADSKLETSAELLNFSTAHGILALIDLLHNEITVSDEPTTKPYEISIGAGEEELVKRNQWQYERIAYLEQNNTNLKTQLTACRKGLGSEGLKNHELTQVRDDAFNRIRELELTIQRIKNFATEWEHRGLDTILTKDLRGIIDNPISATIVSDSENADTILQPKVT